MSSGNICYNSTALMIVLILEAYVLKTTRTILFISDKHKFSYVHHKAFCIYLSSIYIHDLSTCLRKKKKTPIEKGGIKDKKKNNLLIMSRD